MEAEKEGAGDGALALGMHMTRLTAKALMYLVLCSSPSSGFYNQGQQTNVPQNTHANSNQGNTSSATGTPKSSNAHQTTNNSASNSSTPQAQNSGQLSKPTSLKQTGAKSGLRRAAIGKINNF